MTPLEDSILRTLLYADVFNFPMTLAEIHHFLIASAPVKLASIERTLMQSERLRSVVTCVGGYFMVSGREALADIRHTREEASHRLWEDAVHYGQWLGRIPFVRMVAVTGALAVHNAVPNDDIDYVLVTQERRVWLARAFAIVLVRLARGRGVQLCPNYVLAERALAQDAHNLYMAHEITQMIPIYGLDVYMRMRASNMWVGEQIPNAEAPFYPQDTAIDTKAWRTIKAAAEWVLGSTLGNRLEDWERERKLRRFAPQARESSGARLDAERVKGHFSDHGHPALVQYHERLRAHGLLEET